MKARDLVYYTKAEEEDVIRRIETHHKNAIQIVGFLGAIEFAGLVLVVQSPNFIISPLKFETAYSWGANLQQWYFQFLISFLTVVSVLCIATCLVSMLALSRKYPNMKARKRVYSLTYWATGVCFLAFLSSAYFIVVPIDLFVGEVAVWAGGGIFLVMVLLLAVLRR